MPKGKPHTAEAKAEALRLRTTTDLKAVEIEARTGINERYLRQIWAEAGVKPHPSLRERLKREAAERLRAHDHNPKRTENIAWRRRTAAYREAAREKTLKLFRDPEYVKKHREASRLGGLKNAAIGALKSWQQQQIAWCPEEYRGLYRMLIYSKRYLAIDAMAQVIKQMEIDKRRRTKAAEQEERQHMEAERNFIMGRKAA